jgi:hypothetical protein
MRMRLYYKDMVGSRIFQGICLVALVEQDEYEVRLCTC